MNQDRKELLRLSKNDKTGDTIGDIEELIDKNNSSILKYLKMNIVPTYQIPRILSYYVPIYEEYLEAFDSEEQDLIEAYPDKKKLSKSITLYEKVISDLIEYQGYKKEQRKFQKYRKRKGK
jgi:hypothetical protein